MYFFTGRTDFNGTKCTIIKILHDSFPGKKEMISGPDTEENRLQHEEKTAGLEERWTRSACGVGTLTQLDRNFCNRLGVEGSDHWVKLQDSVSLATVRRGTKTVVTRS